MNYEELLIAADEAGLIVKEKPLALHDGRIKGTRIAIRQDIPTLARKADVLAEELGHYFTSVGEILDQSTSAACRQERQARLWAYNNRVGLSGIVRGHQHHCQNLNDLAEFLDVSEEFLLEALDCYREKYGSSVNWKNFTIFFEPSLAVMEKLEKAEE